MNKPTLFMMIGLSGSGKSTIALKVMKEYNATYHSSDDIRLELFGDENDQTHNEQVFTELHKRIILDLKNGKDTIFDATNLTIKDRSCIFNKIKGIDCEVIAYVIPTPIEICKEQNKNRDRVVPEFVIDKQIRKFQFPFYEEGFSCIIISGREIFKWNMNEFVSEVYKFHKLMRVFDQRNKWHKHDLERHCQLCALHIGNYNHNAPLFQAGLYHDIGKLWTGKQKEDGDYCYYSHENVGTYSLLSNLDLLRLKNYNDILECLFYINYHMLPFNWQLEKTRDKYKLLFGEEKYNNLLLLHKADKISSGTREE